MKSRPNVERIMQVLSDILSEKHGLTVKVEAMEKSAGHPAGEVGDTPCIANSHVKSATAV